MYKLSSQQFAAIFEALRVLGASGGSEKRQATRMDVQAKLTVAPLHGSKIARCFTALTRDVSTAGIGLFQHVPADSGQLFLASFPYGKSQLVITCVSRFCRPVAEGMFGIGAQFEGITEPTLVEQLQDHMGHTLNRIRESILD